MTKRALAIILCSLGLGTNASAQRKAKLAVIPTQFDESARGQVPTLFDDYLLTAVQNTVDADVIGQEDISALLGFEQQKDLLDCSDSSCIADIGGALGVDKIVVVKIARLGQDWVVTAKIINITETRVESRVNEIINGDVKQLLRATTQVVAKLFGEAVPATVAEPPPTSEPAAGPTLAPAGPVSSAPPGYVSKGPAKSKDSSAGGGNRVVGLIMLFGGGVVSILGQIAMFVSYEDVEGSMPMYVGGTSVYAVAQIIEGIGTKIRANGVAQGKFGDPNAYGSPHIFWVAWLAAIAGWGAGAAGAWTVSDPDLEMVGVACGLSSLGLSVVAHAIFLTGAFGGSTPHEATGMVLTPSVQYARLSNGSFTPTYGLDLSF